MHVAPLAVAACCAGFLQAGVATTPTEALVVERGFDYYSANAHATASQGGHPAGGGWAALRDLRQKFEKAREASIQVIARPQIGKTGEAPEEWHVDMPVYIWGCFPRNCLNVAEATVRTAKCELTA